MDIWSCLLWLVFGVICFAAGAALMAISIIWYMTSKDGFWKDLGG